MQAVRSLRLFAADATDIRMHAFFFWFVEGFNEVHEISISVLYIDDASLDNEALFFALKLN